MGENASGGFRPTPREEAKENFWAGLAMRRLIRSSCRARSTPFYFNRRERRASQVQLVHLSKEVSSLTGASSFVVFACVRNMDIMCHVRAMRETSRRHVRARSCPASFGGVAHALGVSLQTGPSHRVCPCSPPPDQLSQWARGDISHFRWEKSFFSRHMIPTVEPLQKLAEQRGAAATMI